MQRTFRARQPWMLGQRRRAGVWRGPPSSRGAWRSVLKAALGLDVIENLLQLLVFKPPLQATGRKPKAVRLQRLNVPRPLLSRLLISELHRPTSPLTPKRRHLYIATHFFPLKNIMKYFKHIKGIENKLILTVIPI